MLPKINQRKTAIPYHSFAKQLLSHKFSENNISKLKLIKQFLEDEENSIKLDRSISQMKKNSDNILAQCPQEHQLKTIRIFHQKQNQTRLRKFRRQSLTAETNSQQLQKPKVSNQKSIFCVPDRFKLNEFFHTGRAKKPVIIKDLLKPSLPNKIFTHRIL